MSYMSWEDLEETYTEMYNRIETNDEGEITMRTVVEHIKGVEAGSGNNIWVNRKLESLLKIRREITHVELDEFLYIIGDLRGAGWTVRVVRENDAISDNDLYHVFKKVDIDNNQEITSTELRLACRYLCKQFQIDIKTEREFRKYMLQSDNDDTGTLDFEEFKVAVKYAQGRTE